MGETVERRLKDYKGYQIYKVIDNKGLKSEKVTYMANTQDGWNFQCANSLQGLRDLVDIYDNDKKKGI